MKIELPIPLSLLRKLRPFKNLEFARSEDGTARIDGRPVPLVLQAVAGELGLAQASELAKSRARLGGPPWLVTSPSSTSSARRTLTREGISFVDGLGNVHLELDPVFVHVEARPAAPVKTSSPSVRLSGKAAVAAQLLLLDRRLEWQVQDLADAAQVSVGLAHRVMRRLEDEGVVSVEGRGPSTVRRVLNRSALIDLLAAEERRTGRETAMGFLLGQQIDDVAHAFASGLSAAGIEYAITGGLAAARRAPFVTAVPRVDLWIVSDVPLDEALLAGGAQRVEAGSNIRLLQARDNSPLAFAEVDADLRFANPIRVYLDLLRDPRRGAEQAEELLKNLDI